MKIKKTREERINELTERIEEVLSEFVGGMNIPDNPLSPPKRLQELMAAKAKRVSSQDLYRAVKELREFVDDVQEGKKLLEVTEVADEIDSLAYELEEEEEAEAEDTR